MRTKTIPIEPLKHKIKITICDNRNEVIARSQKSHAIAATLNHGFGEIEIIFLKNDMNAGIIAHEVYHAVCYMIDNIGDAIEHSEVIAYYIEFLINKIGK